MNTSIDDEARQAFHSDALRVFAIAWQQGQRRYAKRQGFTSLVLPAMTKTPRTEPIRVPTLSEAIRGLFMEAAAYYLRCAEILGETMPAEVSTQLLILHGALNDYEAQAEVLRSAIEFLNADAASLNSVGIAAAIKAARLALAARRDTDSFLTTPSPSKQHWTL